MKIAFVANTSWNIYNFRKGLVHSFLERGDEVLVIAPQDEYTLDIQSWGVHFIGIKLDQTGTNPLKDIQYLYHLIKILNQNRPTAILSFTIKSNIYSSLAGKFCGIPTICNVSGLGTVFLVKGWLGQLAINLYRVAFKHASVIFFQNGDDQKLFVSYIPLHGKIVDLLPGSGVDLKAFSYNAPTFSNPAKILMVSRVIEEKGVREFVSAAKTLKREGVSVKFTLIGSHDESHARSIKSSELEEWVSSGIIDYLRHTNDIISHMISHELIVLPSYREGTPRTLLEGAALGRALLATNVPGCKEVVKEGYNGFLFKVKDSSSLVDKVKLYLSFSKEEKMELSKNSRKLVEDKFDERFVIGRYIEAINQIVDY